jgi:phenylalanyl-tRNA synthetase beta chain
MRVAALSYGRTDATQWAIKDRPADFYDAKGDVEALLAPLRPTFEAAEHPAMHPGRSARVLLAGKPIGFVGELHPRWRQSYELPQAPLLFELELDAVLARELPVAQAIGKFQAVQRDLALVLPESVPFDTVLAAVRSAPGAQGLLTDVLLFDVFRPSAQIAGGLNVGEKSLALRLSLNSPDATLTEEQIEVAVKSVIDVTTERLGARLR